MLVILTRKLLKLLKNKLSNLFILVYGLLYDVYTNLAKRLSDLVPITENAKAVFFNSGAEAVENLLRYLNPYQRSGILVFSWISW